MTRRVTLVLIDGGGAVLGALPPFDVSLPYWQEVSDVVPAALRLYGVPVDVLRLLTTELALPHGGAVTYLAEAADLVDVPLVPVPAAVEALAVAEEPLRSSYARLGGPRASVAWARERLGSIAAQQQRTWNLSAIWRVDHSDGRAWLKQVPAFFAHEAAVLEWLASAAPAHAPHLLGRDGEDRMLLDDVPGEDLYFADLAVRLRISGPAHLVQLAGVDATDQLVAAGVPDRRGALLSAWIRERLVGWVEGHPAEALLDTLDERLAGLASCGLPDTLVHGDAHPGNVRSEGEQTVFLDWGDAFVGNPVFDVATMTGGLPPEDVARLEDAWAAEWERSVPGSNPKRAIELSRAVACLRSAAVYAEFVASIEPTQRVFHAADVPAQLDAAAAAAPPVAPPVAPPAAPPARS